MCVLVCASVTLQCWRAFCCDCAFTADPDPPHTQHTRPNRTVAIMVRSAQAAVSDAFNNHVAAGGDPAAFDSDPVFEGINFDEVSKHHSLCELVLCHADPVLMLAE
jgi:hypothetical protein